MACPWRAGASRLPPAEVDAYRSKLEAVAHAQRAGQLSSMLDPTKNTTPSMPDPTSSTNPGNGAIRMQAAPAAKRTPIYHNTLRGAHRTLSCRGETRESRDACLRCARDDHWVLPPSGRR